MKVERTAADAFAVEFESEDELRSEHRLNLSQGALLIATAETVPAQTKLTIALRGPSGGEASLGAMAVAMLPTGIALAVEGYDEGTLRQLLEEPPDRNQNAWERVRALSQMEKLLLAVRAERSERAVLLQDNDPRVLLSLLRNPRITIDEVARMAKSSFITFQIADVIMKATQWTSSLDVRLALIHNPKTPPALALRILPTLPDADVRAIARAGTSMALKQAALKRLQGR